MLLKGYLASISLERSGCMFGVASSAQGGSCLGFFNVDNVYNGELIPITPPRRFAGASQNACWTAELGRLYSCTFA